MEYLEFIQTIGISPPSIHALENLSIPLEEYQKMKDLFFDTPEAFIQKVQSQPQAPLLSLYYFTRFAWEIGPGYCKKYGDEIYFDTFSDIAIWEDTHYQQTGTLGISELGWLANHLHRRLFSLGRLQFEPIKATQQITETYPLPDDAFLVNVHIPAKGPLPTKEVIDSYHRAYHFFAPKGPLYFTCNSWLIAPVLKELLPAKSNILAFQAPYHVVSQAEDSPQAQERIFGTVLKNPEKYPENSSLQKKAKEHLLAGGTLPCALGIFPYAQLSCEKSK